MAREITHRTNPLVPAAFGHASFLVAKITDHCNIQCSYCHQAAPDTRGTKFMSVETVANALDLFFSQSAAHVLSFEYHGGEPLLAPDAYLRDTAALAREVASERGREIRLFMQTNLVGLNDRRIELLKEIDVHISFSLDGPPRVNDLMRQAGDRVVKSYRMLRAAGVEAGTICVIQPSNVERMREVVAFFDQEGIWSVKFNVMAEDGRAKDKNGLTAEKILAARRVILDYMIETRGKRMKDHALLEEMRRFAERAGAPSSQKFHGCTSLYCGAGRSLFSVSPDGTYFACDRIAEKPRWALGNVNEPFTAEAARKARELKGLFHHKDDWWDRCTYCDAKKICGFSCSAYYVDEVDTREIDCAVTKSTYALFLERQAEVLSLVREIDGPTGLIQIKRARSGAEKSAALRQLKNDVIYAESGADETLAANPIYALVRRGAERYLILKRERRMFEVDDLVAAAAAYNGQLEAETLVAVLARRFGFGAAERAVATFARLVPSAVEPAGVPSAG